MENKNRTYFLLRQDDPVAGRILLTRTTYAINQGKKPQASIFDFKGNVDVKVYHFPKKDIEGKPVLENIYGINLWGEPSLEKYIYIAAKMCKAAGLTLRSETLGESVSIIIEPAQEGGAA